jgi:probable DNA metabolism protein
MFVCIYENTLESLFTAICGLYKDKIVPDIFTCHKELQCSFDTNLLRYGSDPEKAERLKRFILKYSGYEGYKAVLYAASSGNSNKGRIIYDYLAVMFKHKQEAPFMLANKSVHDFYNLSRAVALETHRMKGFIRFKECESGVYYAEYSPDNDITQFIMPHFCERFPSLRFIIHDVKRNIIGIFNGSEYKVFQNQTMLTVFISEEEENYVKIWQSYFKTVNIEERKNIRLQNRCMPKRYRKFMTETK